MDNQTHSQSGSLSLGYFHNNSGDKSDNLSYANLWYSYNL